MCVGRMYVCMCMCVCVCVRACMCFLAMEAGMATRYKEGKCIQQLQPHITICKIDDNQQCQEAIATTEL